MDDADRFAHAPDGLRIHYRDLGPGGVDIPPLVCLPGLTRTVDDFAVVAERIATGAPGEPARRVIVVEYRGRGLSDHDPDPAGYSVATEADDVLAVLQAAGVGEAVILGTSRGGLIAFVLAGRRPSLLRGVILNDIGPVLEAKGLERIRGYVGRMPPIATWAEAVAAVKRSTGADFTDLDEDAWRAFAGLTFTDRGGSFALRYDTALGQAVTALDPAKLPQMWDGFAGFFHAPLLVIRGENSDLLSRETADEMVRRHPDASLLSVANQGHAPLLTDAPTIARIGAFARHCDGVRHAVPEGR